MFDRFDDSIGYYDSVNDAAFIADDFGDLILIPFTIPAYFWQNH